MCAHSKTELSRSLIDQLGQRPFTIWLNAGSCSSLQDDLRAAAISLKDELLQNDLGPSKSNATQDGGFFYTASARIDYLVELLRVWLSMAQAREANIPQVLVVLDDVDGLESSELSKLSKMVSRNGIDVVFSTRDPIIAKRYSYLEATDFDTPPFHRDQAQSLLPDLTKTNADTAASSSADADFLSNVASNLGDLPAALVSGSHYLLDSLASRSPYALNSYLNKWNSPTDRRQILQFRSTDSYPHSMHASFTVSVQRLWRNTEAEGPTLYFCSLSLLRLLSALNIHRFAKIELESLCDLLGSFVAAQEPHDIAASGSEQNGLLVSLRQLSEDGTKAPRCTTELVRVSLLTIPDATAALVLNQLIRACVMLSAQDDSAADQKVNDLGLNGAERLLLERAARQISQSWAPCLSSYETVGQDRI